MEHGSAWPEEFSEEYDRKSRQARERKRRRQEARRAARPAEVLAYEAADREMRARYAADPNILRRDPRDPKQRGLTYWQYIQIHASPSRRDRVAYCVYREEIRRAYRPAPAAAATLAEAVDRRWREGCIWDAGSIGGNPEYVTEGGRYRGLVSDEHAILKLFTGSTHRVGRLRTGCAKGQSNAGNKKLLMLDDEYVESQAKMHRVLRVDIDRDVTVSEIIEMCMAHGRPLPNIVVGWCRQGGAFVRPHLIWLLKRAIWIGSEKCTALQAMMWIRQRELVADLVSEGADPGALSNPRRHKNPLCPKWSRAILAEAPYQLEDFVRRLSVGEVDRILGAGEAAVEARITAELKAGRNPFADHPEEGTALQSNALWAHLVRLARPLTVCFRDKGKGTEQELEQALAEEALKCCGCTHRAEARATQIAADISSWMWERFRPKAAKLSEEEVAQAKAVGQANGAQAKAAATIARLSASYRAIADEGSDPTREAVQDRSGVSKSTVQRHWPAVVAAVAAMSPEPTAGAPVLNPDQKPIQTSDIKGCAGTAPAP